MDKLLKKLIAVLLVISLAGANLALLGTYTMSYALSDEEIANQDTTTENANVEFNAYLDKGAHTQTANAESKDTKLYLNIKVKNAGYLKSGEINLSNVNFKISGDVSNEAVQSVDTKNNKITLKQINNGSDVTIEVPITILDTSKVPVDNFAKESKIKFSGTYVDGSGKEKSISKEIINKLSWENTSEALTNAELTKYIPYAKDGKYGVMVQAKINSEIKDSKLPIKATNLEVTVPTMNSLKPTSVAVIANKTSATNGLNDGVDFSNANYAYNAETGIVTINVKNEADSNGQISWAKGVQDEYLVTFIFEGQEIYNYALANGIDSKIQVSEKIEAYNNKETVLSKSEELLMKTTEKLGTIADFDIEAQKEIAKGYIYANYNATTKVETNYWVKYSSIVNSLDLTESVEFTQSYDKFVREDGQEGSTTVSGNNYAYNKTLKINEKVFTKMLGEAGYIDILNAERTKIGTINKETSKDANGNYTLDISNSNNNNVTIKTSKPISVGTITLEIEKAIKGTVDYSQDQMKQFTKIKAELTGKAATSTVKASQEILLKEPKSVATVEISKKDLTTVVKNENVEIRATLDTSSTYNALYTNPTLKIKLPSYISDVNIKSSNIVMDNGLKIKSVTTEKINGAFVINVVLEGTQKEYTIDAEYKGTIVVLNTDLTVETLTPSGANKIEMTYTNDNKVSTNASGTNQAQINFVAPTGLVAANGISNYAEGKPDLISISDESANATIKPYTEKRVSTITGKIINNYSNKINNVIVLGRIPAKDNQKIDLTEKLGSTFDTTLNTGITVTGINPENYTVYYSTNANATSDLSNTNNGWTTTATTAAKSFLIVTKNYDMEAGKVIEFSYKVEIPEKLAYNNSSYQMYKVYYNNVSSIGTMAETKVSPIVGLTTGQGPELTTELTSTASTVREGQIVKMKVTVKNTGSMTATNVKANIPVPKYAKFIEYVTGNGFFEEDGTTKVINLGTIESGKSATASYYIKIEENIEEFPQIENENDITHEDTEAMEKRFPKEMSNTATITMSEVSGAIPSNECKISILEGKIALQMISDTSESQVLKKGEIVEYTINVENISSMGDLKNTVVTIPLPNGITYKSAIIKNSWDDENGITDGVNYDQATNTVKINLGTLQINKVIILSVEVQDYEGDVSITTKAKADGTEEHYSNITEYIAEKIELEISELSSTPKYVKEGSTVTYSIKLTNKGKSTIYNLKISDLLPDGLNLEKATYTYMNQEKVVTTLTGGKVVISINQLAGGETTDIKVVAKAGLLPDKNDKEVQNKMTITAKNFDTAETNTVTNIIEYYDKIHEEGGGTTPKPTENRFKITGIAWLDGNKDGKRDSKEQLLSNISVVLLNKKDNSIVKDVDTNKEKRTTTNEQGKYEFNNLPQGEYIVIFLYDASRYNITEYQAKGVDGGVNSDAINMNMTIDGNRTIVGTTDAIKITNDNVRDIDIGLYSSEKFDLRLDKYINKITLTTPTIGTKTYDYNDSKIAKIEVLGRNLGKSNIVIEYKIVVKNEGAVAGYAKKIVDYLPKEVGFNTELNKDWYLSENGNVYNGSLANEIIKPGESKELTLVVTKKITEDSLKNLNNRAEIYESYNEQGLKDMDSTEANKATGEDDISSAEVVISLVTGTIIKYTAIILGVIVIIGFGVFEIKRRVLNKKV